MKISIIVPVYNVEQYLDECLESVSTLQTEFECILVDDGSTDTSGALCDTWAAKDSRFRAIHQKNGGLSAARNTGIRNSTGDYLLFLDSDDFLDGEQTDRMLQGVEHQPSVLMGLYRQFYTTENRFEKENSPAFLSLQGLMPVEHFLEVLPPDGRTCYLIACRFVVRRELVVSHELFFLPGIYHEDEEWNGRMLCAAENIFVSNCYFYQYRQARAGSIMSTVKPKHVLDSLRILEKHNLVRQKQVAGSVKERYLLYRMAQQYLNIMLNIRVLDAQTREDVHDKLMSYRTLCVPYLAGSVGKSVKVFSGVFGIRLSCAALNLARKMLK